MRSLSTTKPLREIIPQVIPDRPFTVRLWDGTEIPSSNGNGGPVFTARGPQALTYLLAAPGELGIGRAYVSGALEVDDLDLLTPLISYWDPPQVSGADRARLLAAAALASGPRLPPRPPAAELRPQGRLHGLRRDSRAVRHHYDVSNEFYAQLLDESMTYSCAIYADPGDSLEQAQEHKRATICRKLQLSEGDRLLDVGCGWGALAVHAATQHGAHVVGITLSPEQARGARERAAAAGVADRVEIRVMDYRDLAGEQFDAIASVGMVEHVGEAMIDAYAAQLTNLVVPGGRILNHGIAQRRHPLRQPGPFSERYVFPDANPLHVSRVIAAFERADNDVLHLEGFPQDYIRTLSAWIENLDADLPNAVRLAGEDRVRIWRLYLRGARNGFASGFCSVFQVLIERPTAGKYGRRG